MIVETDNLSFSTSRLGRLGPFGDVSGALTECDIGGTRVVEMFTHAANECLFWGGKKSERK